MPSPFAKTLIDIAVGHLLPAKYSWVSEIEAGPYHVETRASAANGGNTFRALCGASGDFNCHFTARQIIARLKCATCQQLSTTGLQDFQQEEPCLSLAAKGPVNLAAERALQSSVHGGAAEKNTAITLNAGHSTSTSKELNGVDVADQATGNAPVIDGLQVGDEGVGGAISPPCTHGVCVASGAAESIANIPADSQKSFIEKMVPLDRNPGQCVCGSLAKHTCPCGEKVCQAHFYDGEGQHVEAQGFCSACVDLIQAEQHGIERCGRAEAR